MQEQGVIAGFPGGLTIGFVNPVVLYVFGTSSAANMERVVADLGRDDRTYIVLVCARNYLSIGALLRTTMRSRTTWSSSAAALASPT
jgi:hypothetical protein